MRTVIKGGLVCLPSDPMHLDLAVENGVITEIAEKLDVGDDFSIDACGMVVVPGGIDPHTHMDLQQSPHHRACDTFLTGGIAAACGGTTTIIDHIAFGPPGCTLRQPIDAYWDLAKDCPIDYSFHGVLQHVDMDILDELGGLIDAGFPSFKAYTTYGFPLTEAWLMPVLRVMRERAGLLAVHCENDVITNTLRKELGSGERAPIEHARTRPNIAEAMSVNMLLSVARAAGDAPAYIVHLSAHESLDQLRLARQEGQRNAYAETCTQYLTLTEDKLRGNADDAIQYIMAPPLRKAEDCAALWQGLHSGDIQVVATDHCPFMPQEKRAHAKDFRDCPGGTPGVEERMPLLFSDGVLAGRISLPDFVRVTSTNAAKIFGLYPKKGTLLPGSDADIVLIDPQREHTLTARALHSACGWSPYEGMSVRASIALTMLRGEVIAREGTFCGAHGYGQFLQRKRTVPYEEIVRFRS